MHRMFEIKSFSLNFIFSNNVSITITILIYLDLESALEQGLPMRIIISTHPFVNCKGWYQIRSHLNICNYIFMIQVAFSVRSCTQPGLIIYYHGFESVRNGY